MPRPATRTCAETGLTLLPAGGQPGWRVTNDAYVQAGGINNVLANTSIGLLQPNQKDSRGRFDTIGRTVYFGDKPQTSFAEVLQAFRVDLMAMAKDADAIGEPLGEYRRRVAAEHHARNQPAPGEIPLEWQMARSLYRVDLPGSGWWVRIDTPDSLAALSDLLRGSASQLTLADITGDNRGLTTALAEYIRISVLDDGSHPVGIEFASKTGYGTCWAWWNRRADDNLSPGSNDPQLTESLNVNVPELHEVCHRWGLTLVR